MKKLFKTLLISTLTFSLFTACSSKDVEVTDGGNESNQNPNPNQPPPVVDVDNTGNNYALIHVRDFGTITIKLYPEYAPIAVSRFSENAKTGFYNGRNFHRIVEDFMIQGGSYTGTGASDPNAETFKSEPHPEMRHYYGALCMAASGAGDASDSFYIVNSKDTGALENLIPMIPQYENAVANAQYELDDIIKNKEAYEQMYGAFAVANAVASTENSIKHYSTLIDFVTNATDEVKAKYAEVGGAAQLDGGYTVFGYTVDGFDVIDAISAVEKAHNAGGIDSKPSIPLNEIIIETIEIKASLN